MPIDLLSSIKKTSQWTFSSPTLNYILGSSFFVAIIIALLMIILIMILYPAQKNTPFSVVCKLFIYMFFGSMLVVFLHDGVIKTMYEEEQLSKEHDSLMSGVDVVNADVVYNVNPMSTVIPVTNTTNSVSGVNHITNHITNPVTHTPNPVSNIVNNERIDNVSPPNNKSDSLFVGGNDQLYGGKPRARDPNPYKQQFNI